MATGVSAVLKRRTLLAGLVLLLSGCSVTGSSTGDSAAGAHLYLTYGCNVCHRVHGTGSTRAADLTDNITGHDYTLLKYYMVGNPPQAMNYLQNLKVTSKEIRDLQAYLSNTGSHPLAVPTSAPGNAQIGAQYFHAFGCVACHSANGVGGKVGPDLTGDPIGTDAYRLQSFVTHPPAALRRAFNALHVKIRKANVTLQQFANISAFLRSTIKPKPIKQH